MDNNQINNNNNVISPDSVNNTVYANNNVISPDSVNNTVYSNSNVVSPSSVNSVTYSNSSTVQNPNMVNPADINISVNNQSNMANVQQVYNQNAVEKTKLSFSDRISNFRGKLDAFGKSKVFKIIFVIIILLIVLFFGFKFMLVILFNKIADYPKYIIDFENRGNYAISTYEYEPTDDDCLHGDGIKFINVTDNTFAVESIKSLDGEGKKYSSSSLNSSISISNDYTYLSMYRDNKKDYSSGLYFIFNSSSRSKKKYLSKKDISTDLELFNLMNELSDEKVNVFTPVSDIIKLGSLKLFASSVLPDVEQVMVLAGHYDGYVFIKSDNYKEIIVEKGDKRFTILLEGTYFSEEMLQNILNTVVIY